MPLPKDLLLDQTAVILRKSKTLIIADLHLGAEAHLINEGMLIPR